LIRLAVVAHSGKTLEGGLDALRTILAAAGHADPLWYEVRKSRKAGKAVRKALDHGAKLLIVWGGDGMVQHCIDAIRGARAALAIVPAGTANLLATQLGIPRDIAGAVDIALRGARRKLDLGSINGERFAVMAGTGFDARIMREVDGAKKKRLGRLAYLRAGARAMRARRVRTRIRVDGSKWFDGPASAVLVGNVGTVTAGIALFAGASPADGILDVGVVTARSAWQWVRVFSRALGGHAERSPFVDVTRARKIVVRLGSKRPYELDGGVRPPARRLVIRVKRAALMVCVPRAPASEKAPRAALR
jgi:diacylglycerol kinase (ATP)